VFIKKVSIKNFRSLVDTEIELASYSVLVGQNDSGKSNVLRALNLFFNLQTDVGQILVFERDFSQHARLVKNKAKEIEIEVEFAPPKQYTDNTPVIWTKTWRSGSPQPHRESIRRMSGEEFSSRSRTQSWVKQIAFEYVPAIRGRDFFATLKRRLHDTLADTIEQKLQSASGAFLKSVRQEVQAIEHDANTLLNLKTEFSLPRDLGSLFEVLDFDSSDTQNTKTSLLQRGDGIQSRHVPLILKFLAKQRKSLSAKGRPPTETIWAYEEPENNLEFSSQIIEADELAKHSQDLQIILTSHSPAFYAAAKETASNSVVWYASRSNGATSFVQSLSRDTIDANMGLLPFIEPYLKVAKQERSEVLAQLSNAKAATLVSNTPALYVEGDTDKKILEAAWKHRFSSSPNFEIVTKPGLGAGADWVVGCATARAALTDLKHKTAVILDDDHKGNECWEKLVRRLSTLGKEGRVKRFVPGKPNENDHIRRIKKTGVAISIAIEELCSEHCWNYAYSQNWLEPRANLAALNAGLLRNDVSINQIVDEKVENTTDRLYVGYCVVASKKGKFASYAVTNIAATMTPSLMKMLDEINAHFANSAN
jgi:energy-coupling factor transporter ATP-binding protein EcfA2